MRSAGLPLFVMSLLLLPSLSGCRDCYSEKHPGTCTVDTTPLTDKGQDDTDSGGVDDTGHPDDPCYQPATDALAVLDDNCTSCHSGGNSAAGGFDFVTDPSRMVAQGYIVPGHSESSYLYERMDAGLSKDSSGMPPAYQSLRPKQADVDTVKYWIDECNANDPKAEVRHFISNEDLFQAVYDDINGYHDAAEEKFIRYISMVHLYNAGISQDELDLYRVGMSKLLNSLSTASYIAVPVTVEVEDDEGNEIEHILYKIDIRDYDWNLSSTTGRDLVDGWEELIKLNPYQFQYRDANFPLIQTATGSRSPIVNADWLVNRASVSPLYEQILQFPIKVGDFLDQFGTPDPLGDVDDFKVERAGFYQSGVSLNNRMIERHKSSYGNKYCWVSYDFKNSTGTRNLFAHPTDFTQDGGEMICSLPNGMQVYFLGADNDDNLVDETFLASGPINIVSDPNNVDGQYLVLNGRSCFNCHYAGIITKADEIAPSLDEDPFKLSADVKDDVDKLYFGDDILATQAVDQAAFQADVDSTAPELVGDDFVSATEVAEPIWTLSQSFDAALTEPRMMAELGIDPSDDTAVSSFLSSLQSKDPDAYDDINQIISSGSVDRTAFLPLYQRIQCVADGFTSTCTTLTDPCTAPALQADDAQTEGLACLSGQTCLDGNFGDEEGACVACQASETCGDGFDNDCNGVADDGCP